VGRCKRNPKSGKRGKKRKGGTFKGEEDWISDSTQRRRNILSQGEEYVRGGGAGSNSREKD